MERQLSDREMLALTYGAVKVMPNAPKEIVKMLEDHLFGLPVLSCRPEPLRSSSVSLSSSASGG